MLYLDHNSTTPLIDAAARAMDPFIKGEFGNPASVNSVQGRFAKKAIERARGQVAKLVNASAEDVVFVSGGTESCFQAIVGAVLAKPGKRHVVTSSVEHHAVLEAIAFLERHFGADVSVVAVDRSGMIDPSHVLAALRPDTALVSLMLANNETGVCFPVAEIAGLLFSKGVLFHCDAVQAVGKLAVDFSALGAQLLSISAHKFGGPKGVGAVVMKQGTPWEPVIKGGGQEQGRRGGTQAVAQIVGFGAAAEAVAGGSLEDLEKRAAEVRDYFERLLHKEIEDCQVHGVDSPRICNTSSVVFGGLLSSQLIARLGEREVVVSAGSACKEAEVEPSHVLRAMGVSTIDCLSTLRFSFGRESSINDVETLVSILAQEVGELRSKGTALVNQRLR